MAGERIARVVLAGWAFISGYQVPLVIRAAMEDIPGLLFFATGVLAITSLCCVLLILRPTNGTTR